MLKLELGAAFYYTPTMRWMSIDSMIVAMLLFSCLVSCSGEPSSVEELKAAGQKAFLAEDYKTARDFFLQAIIKAPSDKELLFYTGMAYKRDYLYDSAMFYLKRLDILYPNDRETNEQLYEIAMALKDWDYALAALGGLIRTGDNPEWYYGTYAELWAKKDDPSNAYYYIKKAISVDPDNPKAYVQAANLALILESDRSCLGWIDSAVARLGDSDYFRSARAFLLIGLKDYAAAEKIYRSLLSKDTSSASSRLNLAHVLSSQDDRRKKQEALELYRSVSERVSWDFKVDSLIRELEAELE